MKLFDVAFFCDRCLYLQASLYHLVDDPRQSTNVHNELEMMKRSLSFADRTSNATNMPIINVSNTSQDGLIQELDLDLLSPSDQYTL